MAQIELLIVPYHYGFREIDSGAGSGPGRYLSAGIEGMLTDAGHSLTVNALRNVDVDEEEPVVEVSRLLRDSVVGARRRAAFPLVLGGGCSICLGILAGLPPRTGIVWFDAHGDFNTPDTTPSGFFDGMPLAIAAGLGHQPLREALTDRPPVAGERIILVGAQQLDPGEVENLREAGVRRVDYQPWTDGMANALDEALQQLSGRVDQLYLHFDIDVLAPEAAPSVDFREEAGLALPDALAAVTMVAEQFPLAAAALTAFNPERPAPEQTERSGRQIIQTIASLAA